LRLFFFFTFLSKLLENLKFMWLALDSLWTELVHNMETEMYGINVKTSPALSWGHWGQIMRFSKARWAQTSKMTEHQFLPISVPARPTGNR
jgi:hypothetical protein